MTASMKPFKEDNLIRVIIAVCFMVVGVHSPTISTVPQQLSTTTTTLRNYAGRTIQLFTTTTTTTISTTTTTEPSAWDLDWLATLEVPADEYWDKVAQCETASNWKNGGQWGGGLGIFVPTWRGYGGQEYAEKPQEATRDEQIVIANRIALHGYRNASGAVQQPVGFNGWGCIRNNDYLEPTVPNPWTAWRNR